MQKIQESWKNYNDAANELQKLFGRTNNIVGEYAEHLTAQYYKGTLLPASHKSADVKTIEDNKETLYQVKARKLKSLTSSQLGIIRSWDFHYLIVIIFGFNGNILKALEVPIEVAKGYAKVNKHQNGWVITTTKKFLNDSRSREIMNEI